MASFLVASNLCEIHDSFTPDIMTRFMKAEKGI